MNLDEQLRNALDREAAMQRAPAPDVDRLISGGRVRRRRRNMAKFGGAAAVMAVLVGAGGYAAMQPDTGTGLEAVQPQSPTTSETFPDNNGGFIPEGRYRVPVGVDAQGMAIDAEFTVDRPGWMGGGYPVLSSEGGWGGLAVYRPTALSDGSGCFSDVPNYAVGESAPELAQQLSLLPQSTVVTSPQRIDALGYEALALRVRVDNDCDDGAYRVAEGVRGGHGITVGGHPPDVVLDFWVMDLGGTAVVVETWHHADAPSVLVDELARTRDSIAFVTGQ